jgi:hypothetical protein
MKKLVSNNFFHWFQIQHFLILHGVYNFSCSILNMSKFVSSIQACDVTMT